MHPNVRTWRVRGVPQNFDKLQLADTLRYHPDLQSPSRAPAIIGPQHDTSITVRTLASDVQPAQQVATVRFQRLPPRLERLKGGEDLMVDICAVLKNRPIDSKQKQDSIESHIVIIDEHFCGLTVLFSPPDHEHQVDVLAISGLGGHPYGSYINKQDGHMWLSDSLVWDMSSARVMIYGNDTKLKDSESFEDLEGLAGSLQIALSRLIKQSRDSKPLLLIGHSIGGLVIKEALIRIAESDYESGLLDSIAGVLFFGVPNDGMDIESLIPIIKNQPNRFLVETLNQVNSQVLRIQRRNFLKVFEQLHLDIFCFYETKMSPTAAKVLCFVTNL
jgi:hypothetical protein